MRSSGYYGNLTTPTSEQSQARKKIAQSQLNSQSDLSIDCKDLKNDLDSGVSSPGLLSSSRRSSLTSVTSTSSEEDLDSILSSAKKNNNLQKEEMQPEQVAAAEPQMQESENSGDQVKEKLILKSEESGPKLLELKLEKKRKKLF
ncbi:hypothetical protein [Wolbachia endosymbiont (group B) of Xanthorhoe designata]|uniref:hypothetical protein n=1 Tax=Wolbachia endosymbiont (group B) of Xanthorhoe designata TaxID=3066184 RepID=UPI0033408976